MTQTGDEAAVERRVRRRLHRLRVAADTTAPYRTRIAAVKAIQSNLKEGDPLKTRRPEQLLAAIRQPWTSARDCVWQPVKLSDLWD
jgi:hypothetical protein